MKHFLNNSNKKKKQQKKLRHKIQFYRLRYYFGPLPVICLYLCILLSWFSPSIRKIDPKSGLLYLECFLTKILDFFPENEKNEANQKKFGPSLTKNITFAFVSMAIVRVYWLLYVTNA